MKKHLFCLDFVRVISMFIIITYHFNFSIATRGLNGFRIIGNEFANGDLAYIGVGSFFILSGFSLAYSASRSQEAFCLTAFFRKRWLSIFPMFYLAYIVVLLFYVILYGRPFPFSETPPLWTFLLSLVGLDGYAGSFGLTTYLVGEWFLGCLILMYLLFPLLYQWMKKRPQLVVAAVLLLYVLFSVWYPFSPLPRPWNLALRLPEFLFGISLGLYHPRMKKRDVAAAALLLGIMLFIPLRSIRQIYLITATSLSSFVVFCWLGQQAEHASIWIQTAVSRLSAYSFAIFLLHHVISEQTAMIFEGRVFNQLECLLLYALILLLDVLAGVGLKKVTDRLLYSCLSRKTKS